MATLSQAHAVKSLNKSPGRRRFVFKTLSQRLEEVEVEVFRSLDPLKCEPSEGSSFFWGCLVQWRELNTAEDFISFYGIVVSRKIQTLPLVMLHKELIVSELLSRLTMKARLSLEPILRLIAALSRDLLEDFFPFLQKVADSLVCLLKSGADREPEIIEQIFTSWSCIVMYLQKYLVQDIAFILKVTVKLRFYPKDYIQGFMAESMSFLLRNAPVEQLIKGIRKIMFEVVRKPLLNRRFGVSALLQHTMQGTSLRFHSRAEQVLRLLMDTSTFAIGDKLSQGSDIVGEVVIATFQRLCEQFETKELDLMWDCLCEEITDCVNNGCLLHASRLLSLLISTVQIDKGRKISDYKKICGLVELLVQTYIIPSGLLEAEYSHEIVDKVLQLMLCILDGLHSYNDTSSISAVALQWAPIFKFRNSSLLTFIRELLLKDPCIPYAFRANILSVLNDLIETSQEEVIYLTLMFCERMQMQGFNFIDGTSNEGFSRIDSFLREALSQWIAIIHDIIRGDQSSTHFHEAKLALLWGITRCCSYTRDIKGNRLLLMDLLDLLDQLLMLDAGLPRYAWQGLVGAVLSSYRKLLICEYSELEETSKFLHLAKRYKSSSQILLAVADLLDSMHKPTFQADTSNKIVHPELTAEKAREAMEVFSENLCNSDKEIRVSTLRILRHYELLDCDFLMEARSFQKKMETGVSENCPLDTKYNNAFELLHLIEGTPLSIATSRKVTLFISKIQMDLTAARISEGYIPAILNGIVGIFHNRFSYLWNPAVECLAVLINNHVGVVWDIFVCVIEQYQFKFLTCEDVLNIVESDSSDRLSGLVDCFNQFTNRSHDSTPCATVLSLLLQSLQKIPNVVESRSRQIIPLFLKFLGYNIDDLVSVGSFKSHACKGKEWTSVLKEWLNLLKLMGNLKSSYCSRFLKEVLEIRLLDQNDAETQMKVLDCLLIWKDDFLLPYAQHLKNLINSRSLREELTTWSLSKESNFIEQHHRNHLVPLIIQLLMPKVRTPKMLASRKHTSSHHRKAVLGFIAQLDVDELPLFLAMLIKSLRIISEATDISANRLWSSPDNFSGDFQLVSFLKYFTRDNIVALSWKKRFGFMHLIEDILVVFDESRVRPFLDLLMGCVVRVLESCTSSLNSAKCNGNFPMYNDAMNTTVDDEDVASEIHVMTGTSVKQFKELRSLCLKITSHVLNKYDDHFFGCGFWDLFFMSVKPLIHSFKQEASSSEKPSSLFSCFVGMSKSHNLVSLLCREENLVCDIFSILSITTASEAILSCVLKFIENLLILDTELGDEDNSIKQILVPNLDSLICNLHCLFLKKATKRKLFKCPGESELQIFKLLSKYLKGPVLARKFVEILLPLIRMRAQNSDVFVEILQVIRDIVQLVGGEITSKILSEVSPLLTFAGLDVRMSICDLFVSLSQKDPTLVTVAELLRELNATSAVEMGELNYDNILNAYDQINIEFFYRAQQDHALMILSHCIYDVSSEELILRQSAFRSLLSFVEFSAQILAHELRNHSEMPEVMISSADEGWTGVCILRIINKFLLKHMREAMNKETSVHKEWIDLLREIVSKLPESSFKSFKDLCNDDPEVDFFNNIVHLQKHRRARALLRFKDLVSKGGLPEVITNKVFVPLFLNVLFDVQDGKGEHVRNACLETLASISGHMDWNSYYALLVRCFREMTSKPDKQKMLLRLICSILDHFHFSASLDQEAGDGMEYVSSHDTTGSGLSAVLHKGNKSVMFTEIQKCLRKTVLPKLQKILNSDSEKVNVNVSLATLKVLKLLPRDIMESHTPSIIRRISNFLKGRLESTRDEARSALAACLKVLGLGYLQDVISTLRTTLKRGYERHVLGYTLNFILSSHLNPISGNLDYCLVDLLSIVENDIFGDVAEEKEVEKIASKMKETRKNKSFESLKLIAQHVTFKSHAFKLLSPVTTHLQKHLTAKMKSRLETMLSHIAAGIEGNPSVDQTDLFIFIYDLVEDGMTKENHVGENSSISCTDKQFRSDVRRKGIYSGTNIGAEAQFSHLITVFALGLLHNHLKKGKVDSKSEQLLSMLDPFIKLLGNCLNSKFEDILSATLRCLIQLIRLPLPALESQSDKIKAALLDIAQSSFKASSPLMQSCLRLLTVLLRSTKVTLSTDQLHLLIQCPLFVDLETNPSFVALSLLKAIVYRKLVVHEIYDLVTRVSELMVTSQSEPIRKKCSKILLQFLLDYHLSGKRLQQHLDLLLVNLRYEHSTGKEAVLEMLHTIIIKFPKSIVDEQSQTFFVHLVICLANDHDNKIRSMTAAAMKHLIERMSLHSLQLVLDYCLSWYLGEKQQLWSAAAQVLGLLVEVMDKEFRKRVSSVLPVTRTILQAAVTVFKDGQLDLSNETKVPLWKEAYYSLVMLEKMLDQFHELCFESDLEDLWETIVELLLHPHIWLRNISSRLVSLYFSRVKKADNYVSPQGTFFLMRPSRLFGIAVSFCCQLSGQLTDGAMSNMITENIVFSIYHMHSLMRQKECLDAHRFWSALEPQDQGRFLDALQLLDSRKGRGLFTSLTSGVYFNDYRENSEDIRFCLVSNLLKKMGRIALQMEAIQMKIVFNSFKVIASELGQDGCKHYASEMLVPLYKVCEGFSGKVIPDDVKLLAQEACEGIRSAVGIQNFLHVYSQIQKNLKAKREKRRQEEKIMAVTNPMRNAKRKLRISAKHAAHKKRKIMTMKMGRWMR
ncbi:uncharacterized protein LOC131167895 isoform X2 [Malania oleifera]|uniref:uncharacterized protein LOC131167895 isoform X2 n=1 Tax=Malania oleifera TaxID=397392 RepID=UPI0025ADEA98|nr:uncharacterized protein LOC131167895 isoform X2 [Malania oleifera]